MKVRQVLKVVDGGKRYSVIYRSYDQINPYRIYEETYVEGRKHRKKMVDYTTLQSCLYWLAALPDFR